MGAFQILTSQDVQSLDDGAKTNKNQKKTQKICELLSGAKQSIAQKQIAPTTTIISIPIRTGIAPIPSKGEVASRLGSELAACDRAPCSRYRKLGPRIPSFSILGVPGTTRSLVARLDQRQHQGSQE